MTSTHPTAPVCEGMAKGTERVSLSGEGDQTGVDDTGDEGYKKSEIKKFGQNAPRWRGEGNVLSSKDET